jgi:hypothetical protein
MKAIVFQSPAQLASALKSFGVDVD